MIRDLDRRRSDLTAISSSFLTALSPTKVVHRRIAPRTNAAARHACVELRVSASIHIGPRLWGEYPPNLSILISGGKETNRDSLSKGD